MVAANRQGRGDRLVGDREDRERSRLLDAVVREHDGQRAGRLDHRAGESPFSEISTVRVWPRRVRVPVAVREVV
jgi:hypothetical protein